MARKTRALAWARIWLAATASRSPRAGHEQRPRLLPGLAKNIDGIGELEPVGRQTSERAQCGACLPQRQGRGLQPRGSDRAGLRGEISAWARKQVSRAHPNVFQDDFGRARCLQRGQLERRADGQARPVDRQGDQHLPPVVQERTGDQDVRTLGRGDPGHGPIELKCPPLGLGRDQRLGTEPPRGRELGDADRRERFASGDGTQPLAGRRPVHRAVQPADRGVMLREDEDGRQAARGKLRIALQQ